MELTHFDENGNARMVDVSGKDKSSRTAVAEGFITLSREAFTAVADKTVSKGDVLTVAQVAEALGVCTKAVYSLVKSNLLGHVRIGRTIKIPK